MTEQIRMEDACACKTGLVRANNEDNFYFAGHILDRENHGLGETLRWSGEPGAVYAVFDGMGGEACGETAAYLAAAALRDAMARRDTEDFLTRVCLKANGDICAYARRNRSPLMGSTAVLLAVDGDRAEIVNLGDSRAFLLRAGRMEQISTDHTDAAMLERSGAKGRKPRLTQHLGIPPEEMVIEPARRRGRVYPGDVFLLCSDGLTDMVPPEEIARLLSAPGDAAARADALIAAALAGGGRDNVTVIVCRILGK